MTAKVPKYTWNQNDSLDILNVNVHIEGLRNFEDTEVNGVFPLIPDVALNADVMFEATARGFVLEIWGQDELDGAHYMLQVDGLPGELKVRQCKILVKSDAVLICLKKQDAVSWSEELKDGLPVCELKS
ncbi:hypothetical protein EG68_01889 [Paragonimus skrjabini miyazakii]|uniref:CS domain-containing protein n=1 Tax=Paragonimus skrjabini miyazakii TaxID=59628 RepID=A0A8S9YL20_9TREM|nr:hypothetical protein EG68_06067 [Paragonimus skrjabini miyazakii]KAF7260785.1 hypothetical protein EG68_01889 [Paragonimus skrjabini miyazakii]